MVDEVPYSGPQFADNSLVTREEVDAGQIQAPDGTITYTVQPGDNLTQIAQAGGYESLDAFYADNPQYADRNPNLIYPGEVVFVRDPEATPLSAATQEGAQGVLDAQAASQAHADAVTRGDPFVSGSDQRFYNQAVSIAQQEFDAAALAEIEATTDGRGANSREDWGDAAIAAAERIAIRLEAQGHPEQAERVRELGQQRATDISNEI